MSFEILFHLISMDTKLFFHSYWRLNIKWNTFSEVGCFSQIQKDIWAI